MWEIENDPGVGLRRQKKAALVKRLSESRLKPRDRKKKKAENQTGSRTDSAPKRETLVKPGKTKSESVAPADAKTTVARSTRSRDSVTKTVTPEDRQMDEVTSARSVTSVETLAAGRRILPSRTIILARRAAAAKTRSARRKHALNRKIISTKKPIDARNHQQPLRVTRASADPSQTTDETTTVTPAALRRKHSPTGRDVKEDARVPRPVTNSSSPAGSKRKRLTEEQTSAPEEPKKSEVKDIINTQDKDEQNKPKQTNREALIVSEKIWLL
ncbi:serine/arginine repetitive matrix protein 2-like [Sinocyclocheilus grahami]|uniref:serine/arginine repetitive matrix protein 2-like n=1 Tax=Sinocyclocheilus grahami TaxID=75366 RepID=UPI0007ACDADF|nr:PREDICTED: serine/arginine repetitive matrix protein 2-like [Sinocyclocheilus grahami]